MTIPAEEETENGVEAALEQQEPSENVESNDATNLSEPANEVEEDSPKVKNWKESEFAVGLVNVNWKDDRPSWYFNTPEHPDGVDQKSALSAIVCGCLGAKRVGNMAVLAQTTETVEEQICDPSTGSLTTRSRERPKLLWVIGPYWMVNLFITFPLIFGVSGWMLAVRIRNLGLPVIISWSIGTFLMVFSLCMISCRNPGIMYRQPQIPRDAREEWRWNDQARTYRTINSKFDPECQVIIEGFDHT